MPDLTDHDRIAELEGDVRVADAERAVLQVQIDGERAQGTLERKFRDELAAERDRRYAEVAVEREKALQIKEKADDRALQLAREIQTYKDEKANELRAQLADERLGYASKTDLVALTDKIEVLITPLRDERRDYATKDDLKALTEKVEALVAPLQTFVQNQIGGKQGQQDLRGWVAWLIAGLAGIAAVISYATR